MICILPRKEFNKDVSLRGAADVKSMCLITCDVVNVTKPSHGLIRLASTSSAAFKSWGKMLFKMSIGVDWEKIRTI